MGKAVDMAQWVKKLGRKPRAVELAQWSKNWKPGGPYFPKATTKAAASTPVKGRTPGGTTTVPRGGASKTLRPTGPSYPKFPTATQINQMLSQPMAGKYIEGPAKAKPRSKHEVKPRKKATPISSYPKA